MERREKAAEHSMLGRVWHEGVSPGTCLFYLIFSRQRVGYQPRYFPAFRPAPLPPSLYLSMCGSGAEVRGYVGVRGSPGGQGKESYCHDRFLSTCPECLPRPFFSPWATPLLRQLGFLSPCFSRSKESSSSTQLPCPLWLHPVCTRKLVTTWS